MATLEELRAERERRKAQQGGGFLDWVLNGDTFDLGTWLNMAGESMTLGLVGDEAAAKADELIGRGDYEERRDFYRQNEADMRENNPVAAFGADVAGALVPAAGVVGGAAKAATLGKAAMRGAGYGAAAGGTYGFMEGEGNAAERMPNAMAGAALGGAVGAAMQPASQAAFRGADALKAAWARRQANNGLAQTLGVSPKASRVMSEIVDMDDPNAMRASLQRAGTRNMLADSGPMQAGSLDTAMQAPGPSARLARQRIDQRGVDAGRSINQALDDTMGPVRPPNQVAREISENSLPQRTEAYGAAYQTPIDYTTGNAEGARVLEVVDALPARIKSKVAQLVDDQIALDKLDGKPVPDAPLFNEAGERIGDMPTVMQLDYIKKALNRVVSDNTDEFGRVASDGMTASGFARNVKDAAVNATGGDAGTYANALRIGGDKIELDNGLRLGLNMLKNTDNMRLDNVTEQLAEMSADGRASVKAGLRYYIDDLLSRVSAVASDQNVDAREAGKAISLLTSRANRGKLKAILDDDWVKLEPKIDEALTAMGLRANVATNSRTMGRQATDEVLNDAIEPGLLRQGKVVDAAKNTAATMTGASREAVARQKASVKNELADLLTRDGQGMQILDLLEAARQNSQIKRSPALRSALAAALASGSVGAAGANPTLDLLRSLTAQ